MFYWIAQITAKRFACSTDMYLSHVRRQCRTGEVVRLYRQGPAFSCPVCVKLHLHTSHLGVSNDCCTSRPHIQIHCQKQKGEHEEGKKRGEKVLLYYSGKNGFPGAFWDFSSLVGVDQWSRDNS